MIRVELIRDLGSTTHNSAVGVSADLVIQQAVATAVAQPRIGQASDARHEA